MVTKTSVLSWITIGLTGLAFAAAGTAKLMGVPQLHASFALMGLPVWFGYLIGLCELLGAVGLFIRPFSALCASGLIIIMIGAIVFHLKYDVLANGIPAMLLTALLAIIVALRKKDVFFLDNDKYR